jgi:valyl-tRNA synthetase
VGAGSTFAFDRSVRASDAIDTPPPTVSGSLHVGHVFSFTHTDIVAPFSDARARGVLIRWLGRQRLPTERRAELLGGAIRRCRMMRRLRPAEPPKPLQSISRPNFVEPARADGRGRARSRSSGATRLSIDWSLTYATVGTRAAHLAAGVPRLMRDGQAYRSKRHPWTSTPHGGRAADSRTARCRAPCTASASRMPRARAPSDRDDAA